MAAAATPAVPRSAAGDRIRAHLEFLADDMLEGRRPGTRGFDLAAHYVATQFRSIGLEPAVNGGWYQPVPLMERTPNTPTAPSISLGNGGDISEFAVAVISGEGPQRWAGQTMFVGYGLSGPAEGHDDYAGIDVRGKAVVFSSGTPTDLPAAVAKKLAARRADAAFEHGAAGIFELPTPEARKRDSLAQYRKWSGEPFFNWADASGQPFRRIAMRLSGVLWPEAATKLFQGAEMDFATIDSRAALGERLPAFALPAGLKVESSNRWRRYSSSNVIGMVAGSDPKLSAELILVTAHLDHLGTDPSADGPDKIFNGALDNASGVAAMIEAARELAAAPSRPRRTVVFAAVTAEETGLLGSDYLAANPLFDRRKVVAAVNLDGGVPLHDSRGVRAIGGWHSTIGGVVATVAARNGMGLGPDDTPKDEFFERTDHFSFARRGIPAIYLLPDLDDDSKAKPAYKGHNHQPSDDLKLPFHWQAGARFAHVAQQVVRRLADAPQRPRWYSDSQVGALYAPDEPKAARPGGTSAGTRK